MDLEKVIEWPKKYWPQLRRIAKAIGRWWNSLGSDRQRGLLALAIVTLVLAFLLYRSSLVPHVNEDELRHLLHDNIWISYDPQHYDPFEDKYPTRESIQSDLAAISDAGFTGIVTASSEGVLGQIPAIANECNLQVIMGVWDPKNLRELGAAASQRKFVGAYVVGHNRLGYYKVEHLREAANWLRCRTGRPVSTYEYWSRFEETPELCEVGDFLFADVHVARSGGMSRDVDVFAESARTMADLAVRFDKALMLGGVTSPWNGLNGASLESQRAFHKLAMTVTKSDSGLGCEAALVFHSAFDLSWKAESRHFHSWDPFTGLLEPSGEPRPAAKEITK